jgi:hypothetical protein
MGARARFRPSAPIMLMAGNRIHSIRFQFPIPRRKWIVISEIQVNERGSPISRRVGAQLELLRWIGT